MVQKSERKIGIFMSYFNLLISMIIPLFYTPIMLKLLGQAEYGLYGLSQSVISYLNLLNFGMSITVVRYLNKYRNENNKNGIEKMMALFLVIYLCLALLICAIGFSLSGFSGLFFSNGLTNEEISKLSVLIVLMTMNIPIVFLTSVFSSLIISFERFTFKYFIDMLGTVVAPILNLIVLYNGFASVGMACASLFWQILLLPVYIVYCKKKFDIFPNFREIPFGMIKEVFSFSSIIFISSIADLLFWSTDKVLIGSAIGTSAVAVYNIGNTFTTMFQNMSSVVSSVFSVQANNIVFTKQPISESSKLLIKIGRIQFLIISLILSGFIVFGPTFILYWAGEGYSQAYYIALITMVPLTIPMIQTIAFNTIVALNKHLFRSQIYISIAVLNVMSTYLILPYFGIIGAAVCTGVSYILGQGILLNLYYYKVIKINIISFWKNIISMTYIPIIMIVVAKFILNFVTFGGMLELLYGIIIYTIIFIILTWLFTMNRYEKELTLSLVNKFIKR